jgi:Flp pilus assembly protein TadG
MAVEMVVAAPALVLLMLLIAGGGQWIDLSGQVGAAARDAARAASVARTLAAATSGAQSAALADLGGVCAGGPTVTVQTVGGSFADTGQGVQAAPDVQVDVSCVADLSAFKAIGFNVHQTFSDSATVPLDPFMERTG